MPVKRESYAVRVSDYADSDVVVLGSAMRSKALRERRLVLPPVHD
jgi:hypothetical protein